jgi:hypothetical protein
VESRREQLESWLQQSVDYLATNRTKYREHFGCISNWLGMFCESTV